LFEKAIEYEKNHKDGRDYTWTQGETLEELLARKDEIIENHHKVVSRGQYKNSDQHLSSIVSNALDEEDEAMPCLMCHV
jgi:predicted RNase H-like HicB family nuclease